MSRPRGSKNKVGAEVKAQILATYERLGGLQAFAAWAKTHESEFYRMYAQLAPKEIDAIVTHRDETTLTDAELADIATGRGAGTAETTSSPSGDAELH